MSLFSPNLGIEPSKSADIEVSEDMSENSVDNEEYLCYTVNKLEAKSNDSEYKDNLNVVFILDTRVSEAELEVHKKNILDISRTVFKNSPDSRIYIFEQNTDMGYEKGYKVYSAKGNRFFTDYNTLEETLKEVASSGTTENSAVLSDAVGGIISVCDLSRETYAFSLFSQENAIYRIENGYAFLDSAVEKNVDISVIAEIDDSLFNGYAHDMYKRSGGIIIPDNEDFTEAVLKHIYGEIPRSEESVPYNILIATDYRTINLKKPITEKYIENGMKYGHNYIKEDDFDEEDLIDCADTDGDGLWDFQEIKIFKGAIESSENQIIRFEDGELILPTINYMTKEVYKDFYTSEEITEFRECFVEQYGRDVDSGFWNTPVLPIISHPTEIDGDGDSVSDAEECMLKNKNPLILDIVRIMHNEKYSKDVDVNNYLKEVYKIAGSEKLIEYMMEDYYDTASKIDVSTIPDDWWMLYCTKLNEYVKEAYTGKLMPAEVHYFRNNLNRAPFSLDELIYINNNEKNPKKRWLLLPVNKSVFHMFGDNGEYNVKFVSGDKDQMYEAVYNKNGNLVEYTNDPHSCSTYNYTGPNDLKAHAWLDVVPYYVYYSVPGIENPYFEILKKAEFDYLYDSSNPYPISEGIVEEIVALLGLKNTIKYELNSDAKEYRIKNIINYLYADCIEDTNEKKMSKGERPNEN